MKAPQLLLAVFCFSSLVLPAVQECKKEYIRRRPTHTACKPPNKNCIIDKKTVQSAADRQLILKMHNEYRSKVALGKVKGLPPAADMYRLVWDEELASVAQAHADQCTGRNVGTRHDADEDRFTTKFNITGQNIGYAYSSKPEKVSWAGYVEAWFNEYKNCPPEEIRIFNDNGPGIIGHFTQVVWAKTSHVGCGFAQFSNLRDNDHLHWQLYVCNYGVGGNVIRRPVYKAGKACSACPKGSSCDKSSGLCTLADSGHKPASESEKREKAHHKKEQQHPVANGAWTASEATWQRVFVGAAALVLVMLKKDILLLTG